MTPPDTAVLAPPTEPVRRGPEPDLDPEGNSLSDRIVVMTFVIGPFLALVLLAVPMALSGWLSWRDLVIAVPFYLVAGLGITVGFHRHFTHGSFKAARPLRVALAIAGSMAIEGPIIKWVADHRRHHKYADAEGDPHSPWRFGTGFWAITKGFVWAHMGWMGGQEKTNVRRFAPDLIRDRDIHRVDRLFVPIVVASLLAPALIGGLWTMSWQGALTAFFWGSIVRTALLHQVTWSINSVCHMIGDEKFEVRDKSRNVWWLAIPSFGESWHNLHHADPTCARHGVLKGQIDISARIIWFFEKWGWASNVRWPNEERLAAKRVS
ncbi:acyl-CoA desaturase [Allonocardiopsis opalescens]|uniref:Stearoyl-CoA desaturase (Delta-9 desaturase) n=1 Tax=Allonocardiopsis opalescens TaxID=1144618 RepID=A0A2T0QD43_9ACTN|nr:acyl-CoA desaturase [Allonocardiopsis opalescens]PRY01825.1 stearoyl-CoA desaturase (delta-9 desaturase) [Allonocardiopsis opalescens]